MLGFYLVKFNEKNPEAHVYLSMWKTKLDISDANIYILRGTEKGRGAYKELVVSYKCIYINTYNVFISDLSDNDDNNIYMICRHEAF